MSDLQQTLACHTVIVACNYVMFIFVFTSKLTNTNTKPSKINVRSVTGKAGFGGQIQNPGKCMSELSRATCKRLFHVRVACDYYTAALHNVALELHFSWKSFFGNMQFYWTARFLWDALFLWNAPFLENIIFLKCALSSNIPLLCICSFIAALFSSRKFDSSLKLFKS